METFNVFPAIDLRGGQVVRLLQGDPGQQTTYGDDPAAQARRWREAGAAWLHIVNLDGAFGEPGGANQRALEAILKADTGARLQYGGGLRSIEDIDRALALGIDRVILGTVIIEQPELIAEAIQAFGPRRIVAGIDARDNRVRTRGWTEASELDPVTLGSQLARAGVQTAVFTNISRDGAGSGVDLAATERLAKETGLRVIASGGVASLDDVREVKAAGLAGIIIGRALYDGRFTLEEALAC